MDQNEQLRGKCGWCLISAFTITLLRGEEEVEKKTAGHGFRFPKVALASARTVSL